MKEMILSFAIVIVMMGCIGCERQQEKANVEQQSPAVQQPAKPSAISGELKGFLECGGEPFNQTAEKLIAREKPIKKSNGAWTYALKGEIYGLPVKALQTGVCNKKGARDCGAAAYRAIVIDKPFPEVKSELMKKSGIDYTQEMRGEEVGETLRPVLSAGDNKNESILYCDAGEL